MSDDQQLSNNNDVDSIPSQKKSVKEFFSNHFIWIAPLGLLLVILIIILVTSYFLNKPSDMENFADEFCACAESGSSDYYNYTKDGFGYRSDINGCFAEGFISYSDYFNKREKRILLKKFQEAVVKKCPEKLAHVFEYK